MIDGDWGMGGNIEGTGIVSGIFDRSTTIASPSFDVLSHTQFSPQNLRFRWPITLDFLTLSRIF